MKTQSIKFLSFLYVVCFAMNGFAAASAYNDDKLGECHYLMPTQQPTVDDAFFHELIVRGNDENETFQSIATYLEQAATSCHRFQFKYPLKDRDHAQIFAKVLQIKAQEAHRFVPVISFSQWISRSHLGFNRKIKIEGNGPTIQEHVLINRESNQVIFIEESVTDANGDVQLGSFAAQNGIIEEQGSWYFVGTYLYNWEPTTEKVRDIIQMFQDTYENMMHFTENEDVDFVYDHLHEYF